MADPSLSQQRVPTEGPSSTTVRDLFALPQTSEAEHAPEGWKAFQEKMIREVKGIKTTAMPDLAKKMGDLFDIPIPDIFMTSWKKANVLQNLLEESKKNPEMVMELELAEHTINSQHKPHIEVRVQNTTVKKLEFIIRLVFKLKGFVLKIQNGAIREMRSGACDARGTMEYQGLVIAEKKLAPIHLPALVSFPIAQADEKKTVEHPKAAVERLVQPELVAKDNNQVPSTVTEPTKTQAVRTMTGSGSA